MSKRIACLLMLSMVLLTGVGASGDSVDEIMKKLGKILQHPECLKTLDHAKQKQFNKILGEVLSGVSEEVVEYLKALGAKRKDLEAQLSKMPPLPVGRVEKKHRTPDFFKRKRMEKEKRVIERVMDIVANCSLEPLPGMGPLWTKLSVPQRFLLREVQQFNSLDKDELNHDRFETYQYMIGQLANAGVTQIVKTVISLNKEDNPESPTRKFLTHMVDLFSSPKYDNWSCNIWDSEELSKFVVACIKNRLLSERTQDQLVEIAMEKLKNESFPKATIRRCIEIHSRLSERAIAIYGGGHSDTVATVYKNLEEVELHMSQGK